MDEQWHNDKFISGSETYANSRMAERTLKDVVNKMESSSQLKTKSYSSSDVSSGGFGTFFLWLCSAAFILGAIKIVIEKTEEFYLYTIDFFINYWPSIFAILFLLFLVIGSSYKIYQNNKVNCDKIIGRATFILKFLSAVILITLIVGFCLLSLGYPLGVLFITTWTITVLSAGILYFRAKK